MSYLHGARRGRARRRAFTLVEMLVVLAIVGILAAILLPVFGSARESAYSATCSSNLKQINLAISQYVRDSGGFYPNNGAGSDSPPPNCAWPMRISRYLKSPQVLECPSFELGEFREGCPPSEDGNEWDGSYDIASSIDFRNSNGMVSEMRVRAPSQRILAFDGYGVERNFLTIGGEGVSPEEQRQRLIDAGYARHRFGLNALFYDGHVKHIPFDDITTKTFWEYTLLK